MSRIVPLTEAVVPLRGRHATLIDEACSWSAELAAPVDPDLVALILGGVRPFDGREDPFFLWSRIGVRALLRCGIPNWCSANRTHWPVEIGRTAWRWFDFLHGTGRLDPRSDPLWELRKPLICYAGLDLHGVPRPEGTPSPIPCECYLPYRESAEFLNGEIERGALVEDVLVWSPGPW